MRTRTTQRQYLARSRTQGVRQTGQVAYLVRDGNEHPVLPRPDVQVVWRNAGAAVRVAVEPSRACLDLELAPYSVDILLRVIHARVLHHMVAHGRVGPVGPNQEVKADLDLNPVAAGGPLELEPSAISAKVGARQLVVKKERDVGLGAKCVQQTTVEVAAVGGVVCLGGTASGRGS